MILKNISNVVPIKVPSLENRREDIPILANHFVKLLNYSEGLPIRTFSEGALTKLQTMSWPGNIRQLRNAVEQILILGPYNSEIDSSELPESKHIDKNNTGNSVFEDEFINLFGFSIIFLIGLATTLTRSPMICFFDVLPVFIVMTLAIGMMLYEAFFANKK